MTNEHVAGAGSTYHTDQHITHSQELLEIVFYLIDTCAHAS